jgi:hypothetical protein
VSPPPKRPRGGDDWLDGIPEGSILIAAFYVLVAAVSLPALLAFGVLVMLGRWTRLGWQLGAFACICGVVLAKVWHEGFTLAWGAYLEHVLIWRIPGLIDKLGASGWLRQVAPVMLTIAGWLALSLALMDRRGAMRRSTRVLRLRPGAGQAEADSSGVIFLALLCVYPYWFAISSAWQALGRVARGGAALPRRSRQQVPERPFVLGHETTTKRGLRGRSGAVVALTVRAIVQHTLLLGTTGSGKTTALLGLVADAIGQRMPVVFIDMKGDPKNAELIHSWAVEAGAPYYQFSITPGERCDLWNPLAAGTPAERKDKLLALSEWSEPYYKSICERYTQLALATLDQIGEQATLRRVIALLGNPAKLARLADRLPSAERAEVDAYVAQVLADRGHKSALQGLASRLGTLTDLGGPLRDVAGIIAPAAPGVIDLARILDEGGVVVFSLNSSQARLTAAQVGALAILDLTATIGQRITRGTTSPLVCAIDEFAALAAEHVTLLLGQGRSSGCGCMIATQELADLTRIDESFKDQVMALTSTKVYMRQTVAESAEEIARTIGTRSTVKQTFQTDESGIPGLLGQTWTGMASNREVDEFIISPNIIKRLPTGRAIVHQTEPAFDVRLVDIERKQPRELAAVPPPAPRDAAAREDEMLTQLANDTNKDAASTPRTAAKTKQRSEAREHQTSEPTALDADDEPPLPGTTPKAAD